MYWHNPQHIPSRSFVCGHCAHKVASSAGYFSGANQFIHICPHCSNPNYWGNGMGQIPGVSPGRPVEHVPEDINGLYEEARTCASAGSFTGSVLLCRKLLMNIGVQEGAEEGKSFVYYIDFLAEKGFIPPHGRAWVEHIRKKGNEATHEIALMTIDDASELVTFTEMLLKFIYEFPASMSQPDTH